MENDRDCTTPSAAERCPPELLQRIVDMACRANGFWSWREPYAEEALARAMSLTCRAWRPFGQCLLFKSVRGGREKDVAQLQNVLRFPHLLRHVSSLQEMAGSLTAAELALLQRSIPRCSSLRTLRLSTPTLLENLPSCGLAALPELTTLSLGTASHIFHTTTSEWLPGAVLAALVQLRRLDTLDVAAILPSAAVLSLPSSSRISGVAASASLCVSTFGLTLSSAPSTNASFSAQTDVASMFLDALSPDTLKRLDLDLTLTDYSPTLAHVSRFTQLESITFTCRVDFTTLLEPLTSALTSLVHLRYLSFHKPLHSSDCPEWSTDPVSCGDVSAELYKPFFAALPPLLEMFGDHLFVPGGPSNADLTEFLRTRVNSPLHSFVYDAVGDYGRRCKHIAEKLNTTDGREHWINYQSREGLCPSCDDLSADEDVWEIDSTTYEVPEPSRHPRQVYR